jgi:hypothetical protein
VVRLDGHERDRDPAVVDPLRVDLDLLLVTPGLDVELAEDLFADRLADDDLEDDLVLSRFKVEALRVLERERELAIGVRAAASQPCRRGGRRRRRNRLLNQGLAYVRFRVSERNSTVSRD